MAGFLDKNDRIIDLVLTAVGRESLSKGELDFTYWSVFDDEVIYDTVLMDSGSLSAAELSSSVLLGISETLVTEAKAGYRQGKNSLAEDTTNVHRPLFDAPIDQTIVPRMLVSGETGSISIETKQRRIAEYSVRRTHDGRIIEKLGPFDRGTERFETNSVSFEPGYTNGSFPPGSYLEGFLIRTFLSGSGGLEEIDLRQDRLGRVAAGPDISLDILEKRNG